MQGKIKLLPLWANPPARYEKKASRHITADMGNHRCADSCAYPIETLDRRIMFEGMCDYRKREDSVYGPPGMSMPRTLAEIPGMSKRS